MRTYFGHNVRVLRCKNRLSQKQLAELIGYHENEIALWEKGKVEPRLSAILTIASTFRVRVDNLILNNMSWKRYENKGVIRFDTTNENDF